MIVGVDSIPMRTASAVSARTSTSVAWSSRQASIFVPSRPMAVAMALSLARANAPSFSPFWAA
jgi:hypothetical protein